MFFHIKKVFLLIILSGFCFSAFSQEKKRVDILYADYMEADESIAKDVTRLVGSVNIQHEDILMWCDSAYTYTGTNRVDAFGNVRIQQGDTLDLYADKIYYNGDIDFEQAVGNVRLINKTTTLYTDVLDFDLAANIGYYEDFGKIIDETNTLTSIIGKYFIDDDVIHFYKDVEGFNDKYTLNSDTLHYHTETGRFFIVGPTTIRDSTNTLYAEDGWYDTNTGEAELLKNPLVTNEKQQLRANLINYNESNGYGKAAGAVQMEDFENNLMITGEFATYNETLDIATVTDYAVLLVYSKNDPDTLFIHADTLRAVPDIIDDERIIMAFYGARFFRTDLQGVCDSLVYFTRDSLVQLYTLPVIWNDNHQLSADYIEMQQFTDAPNELRLVNNSFIISQQDTDKFDQIKGKNITGYIIENELNNIEVDGNGESIYYAREKGNEFFGLNRASSSIISIRFSEGKINRITFSRQPGEEQKPKGVLEPLEQLSETDKLSGFEWKIDLRPVSKQDLFRHDTAIDNTSTQESINDEFQEVIDEEEPKHSIITE